MRQGIEEIKKSIVTLNEEIQQTGVILSSKGTELVEARIVIRNVTAVIEAITTCQYTLSLARKVRDYIETKRFYPAIKILEQIQQVHLQNVVQYEWGRYLQRKIPLMKLNIKKRVLTDVSSWLLMIRNASGEVGRFSMAQTNATIEKKEELNALRSKDVKEYTDIVITKRKRGASIAPGARPPEAVAAAEAAASASKPGKADSKPKTSPSGAQLSHHPTFTLLSDGSDITEVSVFEVVNLNFAPLYQCSYIHEVLGEKEEFQKYYKESRKLQSNIVLQQPAPGSFMQPTHMTVQSTWTLQMDESSWAPSSGMARSGSAGMTKSISTRTIPSNTSSSNLASLGKLDTSTNQVTLPVYAKYLNAIAGFFIVEATVLQTSNNLITSADVTALWDAASNKMRAVLQVEVAYCEDIDALPELKNYLLVFCRTLRKYGYNLNLMHDFVKTSLRDRYVNVTLDRLTSSISRLCDRADATVALNIKTDKDFQELIVAHDLNSHWRDGTKRNFPYSIVVPELLRICKQFAADLYKFCSNLPDADTIVMHGLDQLLKIIVTTLQMRDYASDPTVLNLGMHFINTFWFQDSLSLLESYLTGLGISGSVKLDPIPFADTCRLLEEMLYDLNTKRIDREFEGFLNTCQPQYSKIQTGPRPHIQNIFNEIMDVFPKLSLMPGAAFDSMYKREFNNLIDRMMGLLLTDRIRYFDLAYVKCLDQDLIYVEECAKKAPVAVLDDSFAELRQIINLLMQPDLKVFFDPALRSTQYNKINNTKKLAAVLKKFKEPGGFGPFSASKAKRKAVKAVMTQLM